MPAHHRRTSTERRPGRERACSASSSGSSTVISGVFARAFRSAVQPVEIAAALQRECDNNAQVLSRQRRLVPNDFHVELSATDLERIVGLGRALEQDLVDQLQDHADAQGYVFTGPISIAFESADDLTTGRFRIRSQGAGERHRQRPAHPHPLLPRHPRGQRHPPPAAPARPGGRPRHRGRPADQRPRREPAPPRARGQHRRRRGGRPRLDQRDPRRRRRRSPAPGCATARRSSIGHTEMTVRIDGGRDEAGGWNV